MLVCVRQCNRKQLYNWRMRIRRLPLRNTIDRRNKEIYMHRNFRVITRKQTNEKETLGFALPRRWRTPKGTLHKPRLPLHTLTDTRNYTSIYMDTVCILKEFTYTCNMISIKRQLNPAYIHGQETVTSLQLIFPTANNKLPFFQFQPANMPRYLCQKSTHTMSNIDILYAHKYIVYMPECTFTHIINKFSQIHNRSRWKSGWRLYQRRTWKTDSIGTMRAEHCQRRQTKKKVERNASSTSEVGQRIGSGDCEGGRKSSSMEGGGGVIQCRREVSIKTRQ